MLSQVLHVNPTRSMQKAARNLLAPAAGFILERIHGQNSDKRIGKATFHDITYVRQLLFSTFKALHAAQRQLAFHHADLRLANIMEMDPSKTPPASPITAPASLRRPTDSNATSRISANSTASPPVFHHGKSDSAQDTALPFSSDLTSDPNLIASVSQSPAQQQQGHWSQAQQDQIIHQFRIIDYGLADFKELFGAGYVRSNNSHRHKRKASMYRGTSLGKMAVPVTDDDQAEATGATEEGYMRAARPIGCVAFLPHPSNLLPQVLNAQIACKLGSVQAHHAGTSYSNIIQAHHTGTSYKHIIIGTSYSCIIQPHHTATSYSHIIQGAATDSQCPIACDL